MSLLGSVLSNMLLTFGMAILAGSLKRHETKFNPNALSTYMVLLIMSCFGLIIPGAYSSVDGATRANLVTMSRFLAVIMIICYLSYLYFQLKSHSDYFEDEESPEDETPFIPVGLAIGLLGLDMYLISWLSDRLVDTLQPTVEQFGVSEYFIGFVLVPLIGNAAEMATAVLMAFHNKMGISFGVAVGSSIQVACFLLPCMVIASWAMGGTLDLNFHVFTTVATFASVIVVSTIVQDGKTNWLEGVYLLLAYTMVAVSYLFLTPKAAA
eukprot:NODE_5483_length_1008_cov_63.625989_g4912_i0.p1 GENE.NODE_5483_length_1008_cov_63.625989_g4912_i0~~NODE_5483_length_1008_cov_63.625989_g4912_i0.p1  ORF type:complete len:298 (-),score=41.54 NODE_5483_length_1008_cov_63.625989_g4912_i0:115-915(-)